MTPFAKTGGLADVAGTLPLALGRLGVEILITMPKYRSLSFTEKKIAENVTLRLIENEAFFNRAALYGHQGDYDDNLARFSFFCRQSLGAARSAGFQPDIVHAHDWQAALLPVYLKTRLNHDDFFKKAKTVLTVHNLAYQGVFPEGQYPALDLDRSLFSVNGFEFYGNINVLKGGLLYADAVTTVSPTYAKEILTQEIGCGLDGVLKKRKKSIAGILNGLDYDLWDPAKDTKLTQNFSADKQEGKAACKAALQKEAGLEIDPAIPLFAMVTRLVGHKGLDIFCDALDRIFSRNAQLVVLGEGEKSYEAALKAAALRYPKKVSTVIGFNTDQAHRIYAGSDLFMMPSYFEPCGLGQMIAMRYGSVPVVRRTGGLADSVIDQKTGFVFDAYSSAELVKTVERALKAWEDKKTFSTIRTRAMKADFSWQKSAQDYKDLYEEMLPAKGGSASGGKK